MTGPGETAWTQGPRTAENRGGSGTRRSRSARTDHSTPVFLVHGGCPPASITQKRPNHGQVSVHSEPKFVEGQQPYVQ